MVESGLSGSVIGGPDSVPGAPSTTKSLSIRTIRISYRAYNTPVATKRLISG